MKLEYDIYKLKPLEVISIAASCLGITVIVSLLFYDSFWGIAASPVIYVIGSRIYRKSRIKARKDQLTSQFIDALKSIGNAMSAGYSMENACLEAQKEMELLYGTEAYMYQEMAEINRSQKMSVALEKSIEEFANRTKNEDIMSFSQIFSFAKRNGGSMVEIIESTTYKINAKYETQKEIEVSIAAKKMEQRVMSALPIFMVAYLRLTSPEYLSRIYGNALGITFMTGCLMVYAIALIGAERIMDIKV